VPSMTIGIDRIIVNVIVDAAGVLVTIGALEKYAARHASVDKVITGNIVWGFKIEVFRTPIVRIDGGETQPVSFDQIQVRMRYILIPNPKISVAIHAIKSRRGEVRHVAP